MSAGIRVAIVGTGAIGDYLAHAIQAGRAGVTLRQNATQLDEGSAIVLLCKN
jgi:ketopantoate reductase